MTDQPDLPQQNSPTIWDKCSPGMLTGYSRRVHRRHLLVLAAKTAGTMGCVAAVGLGGWMEFLRRSQQDYQYYGMTCSDVRELLPAYREGKLDVKRSDVLEKHVRKCAQCANLRSQLRAKTA